MSAHNRDSVQRHYASDANLRIRQETHDKYTVPQVDYVDWCLSAHRWRGDERVLDLGCGPGLYARKLLDRYPKLDYYGFDLLPAMLSNHPARQRTAIADAVQIPFASASFDLVMANHVLHHIEDVPTVLSEMRRVLKPDGILMAATNSTQTMPELQVLMRRAIVLLTRHSAVNVRPPAIPSDHFALENGTRMLARHFFAVVRHDLPADLVFPDVEPAMTYLESTRALREPQLPDDVQWDDMMLIMRQQINQLIKHMGELVIHKLSGVLLATNRGGFIHEYIEHTTPRSSDQ